MSSTFSDVRLWNVTDSTETWLESQQDNGSKQRILLPKKSEAGNDKLVSVESVLDDKVILKYVDPATQSALQGPKGDQGIQGVPGLPGANGVPGANGLGLTYIGFNVPANPQNNETWLEQTSDAGLSPLILWQRFNSKWVELSGNRYGYQTINRSNSVVVDLMCQDADAVESMLTNFMIRYSISAAVSATTYWRIGVFALNVSTAGLSEALLFSVNLNNPSAMTSRQLIRALNAPLFFSAGHGSLRLKIDKIGSVGNIYLNLSFNIHTVRLPDPTPV